MDRFKYSFAPQLGTFTRGELQSQIEAEVMANGNPEQWRDGEFEFNEWLIDALAIGLVVEVDL